MGAEGEHYAHINFSAGKPASWNDLPNSGGSGDYYPRGFIVEFGGMDETLKFICRRRQLWSGATNLIWNLWTSLR